LNPGSKIYSKPKYEGYTEKVFKSLRTINEQQLGTMYFINNYG